MSRQPAPLPPGLRDRPFTTAEAREFALTDRRLRALDLGRPFHGVRAPGTQVTLDQLAHAYAARMPRHELFTHTTAAAIHGLRMPRNFVELQLHVSAAPPHPAPRSRGVIGHQSALVPTIVGGLRVARPVDAWAQCAGILSLDELIVMGDGLLKRHSPIATLGEIESLVAALSGARGVVNLREAVLLMRSRTDSAMETILRLLIVRAGFPEPEVNGPIRNNFGAVIAHGDLVFRAQKVVVEYDGGGHREERQYFRDIYRLDDIMEEGWRAIRVDKFLLARPATLFAKLHRALEGG
ncbi:hypothetical protein QMG83_00980 [Salinibacterium sp. G-O1]|uniref:hypothetical protein n=1 Tax=Salinibacterium sp. G-O1 TaxID=3046208 RepID=UPI0024B9A41B|nr:hypothetical protein [Salinibacterium sp. G-O1]MDJ0333789.1 hypothetical protein [Salinibacterium sp. G-O1]